MADNKHLKEDEEEKIFILEIRFTDNSHYPKVHHKFVLYSLKEL